MQSRWFRCSCCCVALGAIVAQSGCTNSELETAKVAGTVTLDGKPVQKGTIMFVPKMGRGAHGVIEPDGSFKMTTYHPDDGAVVGHSKVSVIVAFDESTTPEEIAKYRLPAKYALASTSGLTCEVKPGEVNDVHLELTSQ